MPSATSRYRTTEDTSLDIIIRDLEERIKILENSPRIGTTSVDTGQITLRGGDIVITDVNDVEVIRLTPNGFDDNPEIRLSPLGPVSDHVNSIYALDTIIDGVSQTLARFDVIDVGSESLDGGSVQLYQTGLVLQHTDMGLGQTAYIKLGTVGGASGKIHFGGRWLDEIHVSSTDAIYTGSFDFGAGFGGVTYTYFYTFATTVAPIIGLLNSGGAVTWCLSTQSTSGFVLVWSGTAAKTVNMWVIRL